MMYKIGKRVFDFISFAIRAKNVTPTNLEGLEWVTVEKNQQKVLWYHIGTLLLFIVPST